MSLKKKWLRLKFRIDVLTRDKFRCRKCGYDLGPQYLDAHHIVDRNEIEGGGYILSNGITLCLECHKKAEVYHSSGKERWVAGYHPDDLYKLIK